MLAARTPDAVPNHPGSTNVQRAQNVPSLQCLPCLPPPLPRVALTVPSDCPSRSNQAPPKLPV